MHYIGLQERYYTHCVGAYVWAPTKRIRYSSQPAGVLRFLTIQKKYSRCGTYVHVLLVYRVQKRQACVERRESVRDSVLLCCALFVVPTTVGRTRGRGGGEAIFHKPNHSSGIICKYVLKIAQIVVAAVE